MHKQFMLAVCEPYTSFSLRIFSTHFLKRGWPELNILTQEVPGSNLVQ